jgi:hypothetical protein
MKADDGNGLDLWIQFQRGVPTRDKVAWKYYSAIRPDLHRTYRIEHGLDAQCACRN